MKIKLLPHFCNKFNRKELLLFLSALFINMNLIAQSPREWLPSDKDPNYDAKKKSLIKTGGDTTNTAAIPKSTTNLPVCFEPFDNTGGDGWQMTPRNDDGSLGPVALGWDFSLYGTIYDQVYINTNGNISFLSGVRQFSPSGFPIGIPMIAAFWADVDTRPSESGAVWFKVFSDRLVVTWDHVGYYEVQTDKTNTFQMIIYANTNPAFKGNDVIFAYGDMQWTTGSASGGVGGFGGSAATVGANNGNGIDYIQTGRFNINSSDAPNSGGAGTPGGVSWLDDKCFGYVVRGYEGNIPPAVAGFPPNDSITVYTGQTLSYNFQFSGPEVNQNVDVTYDLADLCSATVGVTDNNTSNPNVIFTISGTSCNLGQNFVSFIATDNGTPALSDTFNLKVNVILCPSPLPIISDTTICANTIVELTAAGCSGTYNWYDNALGGTPINQTDTFITPSLTDLTTYYVSCTENSCEGELAPVNIFINTAPSVESQTICTGTSTTLLSNGCSGGYIWRTMNGVFLTYGDSYTTPTLTVNTSYLVYCYINSCESPSTQVDVTVTAKPPTPTALNKSICIGNLAVLTASGCSGTYKWVSASTSTTILASTASYTTPALFVSTNYFVSCTIDDCESLQKAVQVLVEVNPSPPTASGASVCSGNTAVLTASGCTGTYRWFSSMTSTAILASTASYTTPVLATNTSYFVSCQGVNCISSRTQANVSVTASSTAPTASGTSICSGNSTILTASGCAGTYRWYSSNTSTAILVSTASYTTPLLTTNTSYFVSCRISNCESSRTQVNVSISSNTPPPTAAGTSICSGNTATLTASGCSGTYKWYTSTTGTTILVSTANYTTPILTSNKSYSVSCTLNNCESSRIQVNVTVSSLTTPTASGASICAGNTATLTASGCTGTYNWYSSITGTAILVSTASYTTPILNTGKSYYVGCKINNCEGVRTQVIVTVDAIPTAPTSNGSSICSGSSTILTATGCSGTYRWYSSSTGTAILASTASYTTPLVVSNTSYFASCKVNNCESSRTQVNITIISPPTAPVGTSASICSGSSAILSASGCTGIYGWYASNTSPTVLNSTANYTTAILSTNTGYFVSCKINNCESTRTQVFAIVTPATLTLSGNSPSGIQQATQKIFSTQTVNIGADAIYRAGNGITLNPGFSANISSVFLAEIVGCN